MLIICNGAFKSGSTWIYALVDSILRLKGVSLSEIPEKYGSGKSPVFRIRESKLVDFIKNENFHDSSYLTKAHFFSLSTLQYRYPDDVKFIFVERDLKDAIVSHYHHFQIYKNTTINFSFYYWLIGRYKAYEIWLFNKRCRKAFGQEYFFEFERMKHDVEGTIGRLALILGMEALSPAVTQQVIGETSLEALRERAQRGDRSFYSGAGIRNDELFRKGGVGGYKDYLSPAALADIEKIESGQFTILGKLVYAAAFTARRKLPVLGAG